MFRGYEAVIGLEVHAQLKTQSKIFSADPTNFDALDNQNTSPVTLGMPGTLPVLNEQSVRLAIVTGLALGCSIRKKSVFSRKNYFYPDLPKGYQISQYDEPICEHGFLEIQSELGPKKIKILRAHLEEDAGKSTHHGEFTLLNYNRAGVPLLEIVSEPDLRTPVEAAEYARTLRQILQYVESCDGNLEEGSLRCDCNVSVRKIGETKLGTKVEIKNINSFRFIEKAIEYEIERQIDEVEAGRNIIQETRLYDPDKNRTFTMRTKENAEDYRYFPDPDILPLVIPEGLIDQVKASIPPLPQERIRIYTQKLGLSDYDAKVLTETRALADYFEMTAELSKKPKEAANWIMNELLRELKSNPQKLTEIKVTPQHLAELIDLVDKSVISGKIAKAVFSEVWASGQNPKSIVNTKGLGQISDESALEKIVDRVLADNEKTVIEYKSGKTKLLGFFVGAIMKETKGQASPEVVNKLLQKKLNG
ncbi:MAG: Asp-tRNA(Asn)/Glu-tRNA(Gln) amidotransferase subunit GatB [Pseudobdellovibrionaceae bacterium]